MNGPEEQDAEYSRLIKLSLDNLEEACMFAVKALTI